jgi:antitoxin component of MazEF toxin-antitoxin module
MLKQKIIKTGNSLAVTIPSQFAKSIGIKPGEQVIVNTNEEKAEITYVFSASLKQLPLSKGFLK